MKNESHCDITYHIQNMESQQWFKKFLAKKKKAKKKSKTLKLKKLVSILAIHRASIKNLDTF